MANKPKNKKPTDETVREARDRMQVSTDHALSVVGAEKALAERTVKEQIEKESAIAQIYEMSGKIKAAAFFEAQSRAMRLIYLKRVKDSKEYRERFGLTWEQFCEHVGENRRTLDDQLLDLKPFKAEFLTKFVTAFGCEIHQIKYLGDAISANIAKIQDDAILFQGETIPITPDHKYAVLAVLERLEETYKSQIEETSATLRAKDKVLKAKEEVIHKQERTLRKFEKDAAAKGLTLEEDAFLQQMANLRTLFDGSFMLKLDPVRVKFDGEPTPRMTAALVESIGYMRRQILAAYDTAIEMYGDVHDDDGFEFKPPKGKVK